MRFLNETDNKTDLKSKFARVTNVIGGMTRVTGLLLTVVSMHILIIRPLVQRVDHLQAELNTIEVTLSRVASEQSHIHSTNDLLSELKTQHDSIAAARATLHQMQKLREEIKIESDKIPEAMEAVTRLSELPVHLHNSELERYTTLVKPVPNPYLVQNTNSSGSYSHSFEVEKGERPEQFLEANSDESRGLAAPFLFISGQNKNLERLSEKQSNYFIQ